MSGLKVFVQTALPDDYKVAKLAESLKVDEVKALGHVVILWCRVMAAEKLTGALSPWDDAWIARQAKWDGPANIFVDALVSCKLLDGDPGSRIVHDWPEHQGNLVKQRADNAARQKRYYAKLKGGAPPPPPAAAPAPAPKPKTPPASTKKLLKKETANAEALAVTTEIVELWNHGRADTSWIRVTPKRVAKVAARLKDKFTKEDLRKAIANIKASEFHNGAGANGWRCPGPEWVFNTYEKCEEWVKKTVAEKTLTPSSPVDPIQDLRDAVNRKFGGGA